MEKASGKPRKNTSGGGSVDAQVELYGIFFPLAQGMDKTYSNGDLLRQLLNPHE